MTGPGNFVIKCATDFFDCTYELLYGNNSAEKDLKMIKVSIK
jgi:hypothetical protein